MELVQYLKEVPMAIIIIASLMLGFVTLVIVVQYVKQKGLEGIRNDVYSLILTAEHLFAESEAGQEKFNWVIEQTLMILPIWLRMMISEKTLKKIIQRWFIGVKDLLDDGKVNDSQ